jgi:hypothetical protein
MWCLHHAGADTLHSFRGLESCTPGAMAEVCDATDVLPGGGGKGAVHAFMFMVSLHDMHLAFGLAGPARTFRNCHTIDEYALLSVLQPTLTSRNCRRRTGPWQPVQLCCTTAC